jgi:hypothetical protein
MTYSNLLGSERSVTKLIPVSCSVERIGTKIEIEVNLLKETSNEILN